MAANVEIISQNYHPSPKSRFIWDPNKCHFVSAVAYKVKRGQCGREMPVRVRFNLKIVTAAVSQIRKILKLMGLAPHAHLAV